MGTCRCLPWGRDFGLDDVADQGMLQESLTALDMSQLHRCISAVEAIVAHYGHQPRVTVLVLPGRGAITAELSGVRMRGQDLPGRFASVLPSLNTSWSP